MIVVVGEALVDVVVDTDGDTIETPGGSPLNVAVGLGRLDVPTSLITQLGEDERAGVALRHLESSGVEVLTNPTTTGRTALAVAQLDAHGVASYRFDLDWTLPVRDLPPCRALHVGSLGVQLAPGNHAVLDLVEQAVARDTFVSLDVNLREPFVDDRARVARDTRRLAGRCTLVKLSDEDAHLLDPTRDPEEVARGLLGGRTAAVVLTRGGAGASAYSSAGSVHVPAPTVEVVDTVGAGDAFMAGLLAQLWEAEALGAPVRLASQDMERWLAGATAVAAVTCERRGANPPRREALARSLPRGWPG